MHIGIRFWSMVRSWGWKWTRNPHAARALTRTGRGTRIPKSSQRDQCDPSELVRTIVEYARAKTNDWGRRRFDAIIAVMTFAPLLLADKMAVLEIRQTDSSIFGKPVDFEQKGFPII